MFAILGDTPWPLPVFYVGKIRAMYCSIRVRLGLERGCIGVATGLVCFPYASVMLW